jgi:hypothetical protein
VTPQKRKVSPKKPSARKKTCTNKPQLEATLTDDDISLVHRAMEDASKDMLQRYREKQEELYGRIERELKEVQQVVRLVHAVPTVSSTPSSSQTAELGDEPVQLRRLVMQQKLGSRELRKRRRRLQKP